MLVSHSHYTLEAYQAYKHKAAYQAYKHRGENWSYSEPFTDQAEGKMVELDRSSSLSWWTWPRPH